jgi:EmrB/QacA subfamily drug resistance transporter
MNAIPEQRIHHANDERWVLVAAVLASSMAFIDATALNVALPVIQSEFAASGAELLWIINAYALVTAALILFGGVIGDYLGRVKIFALGIGLFVAASLACGLAPSSEALIAARAIQGLGAALMIPGSLSLIAATFECSRRGRAIGIWSACSVVMTALGPIIGGLLADAGWWRFIFFLNLPIGALALAVLSLKVSAAEVWVTEGSTTRTPSGLEQTDFVGACLCIVALAALNFGLIELGNRSWSDPLLITSFGTFSASLMAFILNEARCQFPLLPLDLFRNRNFLAASQMALSFYCGLYGMLFFLALNLVQVQGYLASAAGLAQLPVIILVMLFSPVAGYLVDRVGPRVPIACGGVLGVLGFALLARPGVTLGPVDYQTTFLPPLILLGMSMGMSAAPLTTTILNCVPEARLGLASGVNSTLSRLSSVLGLVILGSISLDRFSKSLLQKVDSLDLSEELLANLREQSKGFADTVPPEGLSPAMTEIVQQSIQMAFIDSFRTVSLVSATVLGVSTLIAVMLLQNRNDSIVLPSADNAVASADNALGSIQP